MDADDVEPATATFDVCNANFEIGARTKVAMTSRESSY